MAIFKVPIKSFFGEGYLIQHESYLSHNDQGSAAKESIKTFTRGEHINNHKIYWFTDYWQSWSRVSKNEDF